MGTLKMDMKEQDKKSIEGSRKAKLAWIMLFFDSICGGVALLLHYWVTGLEEIDGSMAIWVLAVFFLGFAGRVLLSTPFFLVFFRYRNFTRPWVLELLMFIPIAFAANSLMLLVFFFVGWDAIFALVTGTLVARFIVYQLYEVDRGSKNDQGS